MLSKVPSCLFTYLPVQMFNCSPTHLLAYLVSQWLGYLVKCTQTYSSTCLSDCSLNSPLAYLLNYKLTAQLLAWLLTGLVALPQLKHKNVGDGSHRLWAVPEKLMEIIAKSPNSGVTGHVWNSIIHHHHHPCSSFTKLSQPNSKFFNSNLFGEKLNSKISHRALIRQKRRNRRCTHCDYVVTYLLALGHKRTQVHFSRKNWLNSVPSGLNFRVWSLSQITKAMSNSFCYLACWTVHSKHRDNKSSKKPSSRTSSRKIILAHGLQPAATICFCNHWLISLLRIPSWELANVQCQSTEGHCQTNCGLY